MTSINWLEETNKRKDELIATTQQFLQIKSVLDPETAREGPRLEKGFSKRLTLR